VNVSIPLPEPTVATTDRQPVPLLDLKAQYATIRDEVRAAIDRVVESQHFILGPEVEAELLRLRQEGLRAKEAVAQMASKTGLPRRELYRAWLGAKRAP